MIRSHPLMMHSGLTIHLQVRVGSGRVGCLHVAVPQAQRMLSSLCMIGWMEKLHADKTIKLLLSCLVFGLTWYCRAIWATGTGL